ncbi:MAG: chorismate mutase [Bacteroidota bacterium]
MRAERGTGREAPAPLATDARAMDLRAVSSALPHLDALRRTLTEADPPIAPDAAALGPWRDRIDALDRAVSALLNERMRCAHAIGEIKRQVDVPVYAPRREEEVLANVSRVEGPLPETVVRRLFERIIDETRTLEREATERGRDEQTDGAA